MLLMAAAILALAGILLVSLIFVGSTLCIFISKSKKRKAVRSVLGEASIGIRAIHMQLTQIRDEIGGGSYDGATVVNRLETAEASGAYRRGDALDKRRKLMEAWAAYCEPKERCVFVQVEAPLNSS